MCDAAEICVCNTAAADRWGSRCRHGVCSQLLGLPWPCTLLALLVSGKLLWGCLWLQQRALQSKKSDARHLGCMSGVLADDDAYAVGL
jgi:hypothetical protein